MNNLRATLISHLEDEIEIINLNIDDNVTAWKESKISVVEYSLKKDYYFETLKMLAVKSEILKFKKLWY